MRKTDTLRYPQTPSPSDSPMPSNKSLENIYIAVLLPVTVGALGWAVYNFPGARMDWRLVGLTIITVFFSSFLRIQLPRTKIHVTTSDAAIILSLLWYGSEIAIILSFLETAFTSISFRRQGGTIRYKTILVNIVISVATVFVTTMVVRVLFGPAPQVMESGDITQFILMLALMGFSLFILNSALVSLFFAAKNDKPILSVWTQYCLNALVMYLSSAVLAGFTTKAIQEINIFLFAAVCVFFGTVYITYRRYITDIRDTAAVAEQAERERAEQAEVHVKQLQHYVKKLEQSGEELQESHDRLRHGAYHDALTGLPNRNQFIETIGELLQKCHRALGRPFAVLYLDLNRFKTINDSLGHTRGDRLIRDVAARLKETAGENNIVGRFSGDEFGIIVPSVVNHRDVITLANTVAEQIAKPFSLDGREVYTSGCVGITFGSREYETAENVLRDADIAMYHAKDTKQKFVVFDQKMHDRAVNLMQLETDLRYAIDRKEFVLHYQPIVSLEDAWPAGFEALVRWKHPIRGMVMPNDFIPAAESTDLIVPLTLLILEEACRRASDWSKIFDRPIFVNVNLSGRHFDNPDLVEQIRGVLQATRVDPACLKLEITETAVMENAEAAISMLERIKQLGVTISIDDFGTGYSSLSYLHRFPIDTLKIDRSFVNAIEYGSDDRQIVGTIINLAKGLNLDIVAEGIENIHQFQYLRMLGCDFGQGYLFSRPMPAAEVERFLANSHSWREDLFPNDFLLLLQNSGDSYSHLTN
jgi:diguanylate cyclase (GGDEF)-like protein